MKNKNMTEIIMPVRSSMPPFEEYIETIRPLWKSRWLSNEGVILREFKGRVKEYLGVDNIELFVNGHMSLEMAIAAMDIKGEVITTPFTYISTPNAIVRNGLTPVFCDIKEDDFNIDTDKIEALITERTSAILPVHIYGNPCEVDKIESIAKKHNLKVIYDGAQAFGVSIDGKSLLDYGDASMVSFHATKSFHSIEGGAVVYSDKAKENFFSNIGDCGTISEDGFEMVGPNGKMNEYQAAMGLCNLNHVDQEISKRRAIYHRYMEELKGIDGIYTIPEDRRVKKNHTYMPVRVDKEVYGKSRDDLLAELHKKNIFAGTFFSPMVIDFNYYSDRYNKENLPVATKLCEQIMMLPMHAEMKIESVEEICKVIRVFQKK